MTLPYSRFEASIRRLVRISDRIGDSWTLERDHNTDRCYIAKKVVQCSTCDESAEVNDEPTDMSALPESSGVLTRADYHVVYSTTYEVPVLYFNIAYDSQLLSLADVWKTVPSSYQQGNPWAFITQTEHPVLSRPYFSIHPCHTATLMSKISQPQSDNYVVTWLSAYGPVVNLKIPFDYMIDEDVR